MKRSKILEFQNSSELDQLDEELTDLLSQRIYPLTKGIPFCCAKIEHCWELFKGTGAGKKSKECERCKLKKWCNYAGEDFKIKAIENCDPDLLKFLEERDENIDDWF